MYDSDNLYYSYKAVTGTNGIISALVKSVGGTENYNAGAVVIRQNLNTEVATTTTAVPISLCAIGKNGPASHYYRTSSTTQSGYAAGATVAPNNYIRIQKVGNLIICAYSTDGTSYTEINRQTIIFTGTYYVGVAGLSYNQRTSATFEKIDISGFNGYCHNHGDCKTQRGKS